MYPTVIAHAARGFHQSSRPHLGWYIMEVYYVPYDVTGLKEGLSH